MKNIINFICFSKNRPLQLDGYINSFMYAFNEHKSKVKLFVLYTCDNQYKQSYNKIISSYPDVTFIKETDFYLDLYHIMFNFKEELVCFGCDDCIFTDKINVNDVFYAMSDEMAFSFSFRLGLNIKKSMFYGEYQHPIFLPHDNLLKWDLHSSHSSVDFGYSFELNGTVYFNEIILKVIQEFNPSTPNILEAGGGGRWSKLTKKRHSYAYKKSKVVVPTLNTIQTNFSTSVLFNISAENLLKLYEIGFVIDTDRYYNISYDCIHIGDCFLKNKLL